jgi:hypothetical protein
VTDEESAQAVTPLAGRDPIRGALLPVWPARGAFLVAIGVGIFAGRWLWLDSGFAEWQNWMLSICLLPVLVLLLSEGLGRLVFQIHLRGKT